MARSANQNAHTPRDSGFSQPPHLPSPEVTAWPQCEGMGKGVPLEAGEGSMPGSFEESRPGPTGGMPLWAVEESSAPVPPMKPTAGEATPEQAHLLRLLAEQLMLLNRNQVQLQRSGEELKERLQQMEVSAQAMDARTRQGQEAKQQALASHLQSETHRLEKRVQELAQLIEDKSLVLASKEDLRSLQDVPAGVLKKLPPLVEDLTRVAEQQQAGTKQLQQTLTGFKNLGLFLVLQGTGIALLTAAFILLSQMIWPPNPPVGVQLQLLRLEKAVQALQKRLPGK